MVRNNILDGKAGIRIVLTGERREGKFLVTVEQRPMWPSYSQFKLLTALLKHHVDTGGLEFLSKSGTAYPSSICRLRKAVDDVARIGAGRELIETGAGAEYRLAPPTRIQVDRSISQPLRLLPASLLEKIDAA